MPSGYRLGVDAGGWTVDTHGKGKGESQESFSSILVLSLENPSKQLNVASRENNFMKKKDVTELKCRMRIDLSVLYIAWQ